MQLSILEYVQDAAVDREEVLRSEPTPANADREDMLLSHEPADDNDRSEALCSGDAQELDDRDEVIRSDKAQQDDRGEVLRSSVSAVSAAPAPAPAAQRTPAASQEDALAMFETALLEKGTIYTKLAMLHFPYTAM